MSAAAGVPLQSVISMRGELRSKDTVAKYITAGRAIVTVRSTKTGTRLTFKFKAAKGGDAFWVSILRGPDNTEDYTFLGGMKLDPHGIWQVVGRNRSQVGEEAAAVKALRWLVLMLNSDSDKVVEQAQVWHEGRCGRCGRRLTVPESIETGLGPECAGRAR